MEEWRERAIEMFPELRGELLDEEEIMTPSDLWLDLAARVDEAHRAGDEDLLRRLHDYAAWSLVEDGEEGDAARHWFYNPLFDDPSRRAAVVPWLTPKIAGEMRPWWRYRLGRLRMWKIDKLLRRQFGASYDAEPEWVVHKPQAHFIRRRLANYARRRRRARRGV